MKEQEPWNEALRTSPFHKPRFTEQLKHEIMSKTQIRSKPGIRWPLSIAAIALLLVFGAAWVMELPQAMKQLVQMQPADIETLPPNPDRGISQAVKMRSEYVQDGKVLFQIFPQPDLAAGKPQGYMIHFTEPFTTFSGKKLSIDAYQQEANKQVAALLPQLITEPSPGYATLGRFITQFSLPFGGIWRFQVKLDGEFYGDAILDVADASPWTASPTFELPYIGNDGKPHKYVLAGEEGKVGFILQQPILAGKTNKYMWHFWASEGGSKNEELAGSFNVMALKEGAKQEIGIFSADSLGGPNNGADAHIPSSMELPEPGMWRLNAYINNKLFGSVYVKVAFLAPVSEALK